MLRIVAETHYQLGVAQGFNAQYDEAVESLKNAINLLKSRIGNLQKAEDEETKKEVTDLKALISEIEENIKDTEVSLGYGLYLVGALITFIPGPKEGDFWWRVYRVRSQQDR